MTDTTIPENAAESGSAAKYSPMQVLATQQISPRRSKTPEGFLLCLDVPVARVGEMIYADGEIPVEAKNGVIRIRREEDQLHAPEAIASLLAKPVTDEHPPPGELVTPENARQLSKGVVLNPRADFLEDSAVILCDLLITDKQTIENVDAGKVEVSAGYEADYDDLGDGTGTQTNIIFNHVALVLNGRCGPRCAIGDHQTVPTPDEELTMPQSQTVRVASTKPATKPRVTFLDRLRALTRDAEAEIGGAPDVEGQGLVTEALTDGSETTGQNDTHIHLHLGSATTDAGTGMPGAAAETAPDPDASANPTLDQEGGDPTEARISALETGMGELKAMMQKLLGMQQEDLQADAEGREAVEAAVTKDEAPAPADEEKKDEEKRAITGDSAALATAYQQVLADAAILVPGFRMPTFDAKAKRAATIDTMCATRRRALDIFSATEEGIEMVKSVNANVLPDISKLDCQATAVLFNATAGAKKLINNRAATADANRVPNHAEKPEVPEGGVVGAFSTIEELNKFNAQFYGPKS